MTGPCLELLFSQLELLKQSADTGSLLPREELIYAHTVQVVENLIAQVFECYFTAGDAQGIGGMGQEGEAQAAVLRPAVELFKRALLSFVVAVDVYICLFLRVALCVHDAVLVFVLCPTFPSPPQFSRTATTQPTGSGCVTGCASQHTGSTTSWPSMQSRNRASWQTGTQVLMAYVCACC